MSNDLTFKKGDRISLRLSEYDALVLNAVVPYYCSLGDFIHFESKTEVIKMAFRMAGSRLEKAGYLSSK